jgi:hypothetical protein
MRHGDDGTFGRQARLVLRTERPQEVVADEVFGVRFRSRTSTLIFSRLRAYRRIALGSEDGRPRDGPGIVDRYDRPAVGQRSGSNIETTGFVETARSTAPL